MKFILSVALALVLGTCALSLKAQYHPQFPELNVKDDYTNSEALFQQVTTWLNENDLGTQEDLRAQSNAFIIKWLSGSPNVFILMVKHHTMLFDKNIQLMAIYMANYGSYCISNKEYKDAKEPAKAGLQAVVKVYRKGIGVKKDKALDKLVAAADKNELDEYVDKNLKDILKPR